MLANRVFHLQKKAHVGFETPLVNNRSLPSLEQNNTHHVPLFKMFVVDIDVEHDEVSPIS